MKKLNSFIYYFICTTILILIISAVYHLRFEKIDRLWVLYTISLDVLFVLPLNAAISIMWPLIFRTKKDMQTGNAGLSFFIMVYIFVVLGSAVALQELGIPKLYDIATHQTQLRQMGLRSRHIGDRTGAKFSMNEFNMVRYMPYKSNVAFAMGNGVVYFQRMYNGGGAYYIEGFRYIAYNKYNQLDYILTCGYAKLVGTELYAVNPYYNGKEVKGVRRVPIVYSADGIYALSSEATTKIASLIDVFQYNDYVFGSRINFFHLGNIVFNKLAYYIALAFILIIASSIGFAYRNQKPVNKEYFQAASFYALSFAVLAILYDTLVALTNMIYTMVI
jgi:hypothetical protein